MSNISVLSRISGVQQVVGAKTTPFVTTDAELVNDDKQHAALVRAIYNDQVSALSENSQILKPEDIASMAFRGRPGFERWIETDSLIFGRAGACPIAALDHGKALIAGGETAATWTPIPNAVTATCELFDVATRQWNLTAPLAKARGGHNVAVLPGNKALIFGGFNQGPDWTIETNVAELSCQIYDGNTETWGPAASMPAGFVPFGPLVYHAIIKGGPCDGHVLVGCSGASFVGGNDPANAGFSASLNVRRYNPTANTWHVCAPMNFDRAAGIMVALGGGKVMAIGGVDANYTDSANGVCEIYNSATDTWTLTAQMPATVLADQANGIAANDYTTVGPGAILVENGSKVLVVGGEAGAPTFVSRKGLYLYTVATNSWVALNGTGQQLIQGAGIYPLIFALKGTNNVIFTSGETNLPDFSDYVTNDVTSIIGTNNYKVRVTKPFPGAAFNSDKPALNGSNNMQYAQLSTGDILWAGSWPGFSYYDAFDPTTPIDRTCNNRSFLWEVGAPENGNASRPPFPHARGQDLTAPQRTAIRATKRGR